MRGFLLLFALFVGAPAVLIATSGGAAADGVVGVELSEWRIGVDAGSVRAGEVTFETRNTGAVEHELLVVKTGRAPEDIPLGLEGPAVGLVGKVVLGKVHKHQPGLTLKRQQHLQPGRARRDTVRLSPGAYVLLCTLPGHYQAGQRASLTVSR